MIVDFPNIPPPQSGDTYVAPNGVEYFFDGVKWIGSGQASGAYHGVPDQTGNAGKYLRTNGNTPYWSTITNFSLDWSSLIGTPPGVSTFNNDVGYLTTTTWEALGGTPPAISAFNNDVGYLTTTTWDALGGTIPNVSTFNNDVGYLTTATLPTTSNMEVLNVLYVSKSGNDANDGKTLGTSFLTIKAAAAAASTGTTIFVKSGDYTEINPIQVPAYVSIVGDNLRSVTVRPATPTDDIFYVNNGTYLAQMTFKGHVSPAAAVAFNPDSSAGVIVQSPYVQNCSSITTTGTGMRVDGNFVQGLQSMVTDAFTQYNQGGIGIHILNQGYAQLVSVFTICCDVGFLCQSGGRCSITNSNSSFGNYALKAEGTSDVLYTGAVLTTFAAKSTFTAFNVTKTPNIGDALKFNGNSNYYTISEVVDQGGGTYTITVEERVRTTTNAGTLINFYEHSVITAAGHTFEWIGAGTNINTALPTLGGVPIAANQAVQTGGGKVFFTGTDQKGDFRIGSGLTINNNLGTISGRTFTKSLFGIMTPYILAIGR